MREEFSSADHESPAETQSPDSDNSAESSASSVEAVSAKAGASASASGAGGGGESERLRILELLEQRRITAAEAADLLAALGGERIADGRRRERARWLAEELAPPSDRGRWIRVRVTDARTGRVRTNVSVPIGMLGFGLSFARRFRRVPGVAVVDEVYEAVRSGRRGTLFDVANEGGERVEILID